MWRSSKKWCELRVPVQALIPDLDHTVGLPGEWAASPQNPHSTVGNRALTGGCRKPGHGVPGKDPVLDLIIKLVATRVHATLIMNILPIHTHMHTYMVQ